MNRTDMKTTFESALKSKARSESCQTQIQRFSKRKGHKEQKKNKLLREIEYES